MHKSFIFLLLAFVFSFGLVACGGTGIESAPTDPADYIIQTRRDAAESYMRQMAVCPWQVLCSPISVPTER